MEQMDPPCRGREGELSETIEVLAEEGEEDCLGRLNNQRDSRGDRRKGRSILRIQFPYLLLKGT